MNHVLFTGTVTHCMRLEDSIGCWGWIQSGDETAIGFKAYGDAGIRLLEAMVATKSKRVLMTGILNGKPAELITEYWEVL